MKKVFNQPIGHYHGKKVEDYYKLVKNNSESEDGGVDANVFAYLKTALPENLNNKKTVDLGCGDARWSKHLKSLGAKDVLAIDISSDMIDKAKNKSNEIHLIQADIQNLPIKDDSVDLALSTFSIMYFQNLPAVIDEISRILKKDGRAYIATNIINIQDQSLFKKLKGKSIPVDLGIKEKIRLENLVQSPEEYKQAFQNANLDIEIEEHFDPIGVSIPDDYEHKKDLNLEKVLWVLKKT